jgi:hypothetical protein
MRTQHIVRDRFLPSAIRFMVASIILWVCALWGASGSAVAQAPPVPAQAPTSGQTPTTAPVQPAAAAPILPPITVMMTNSDVDPQYQKLAAQFAQVPVPVQFDPIALQVTLAAPPDTLTNPADATPLAHSMRSAYLQLAVQRPDTELTWKNGIDPMFWIPRSKGGTSDWWKAYRALPAAERPPVIAMFPFAYDFDTSTSPAARVRSRDITNQAIDVLLSSGDTNRAGELFGRAVTADPQYAFAAYNQGLFQMVQNNFVPAYKWLKISQNLGLGPNFAPYADSLTANINHLTVLLLMDHGSQRHIYDDLIDAAWAMLNANQPYAASIFAGQASVLDRDEERPEAAVIAALLLARKGQATDVVKFLQIGLERCKSPSATKIVLAALHDALAAANPTDAK